MKKEAEIEGTPFKLVQIETEENGIEYFAALGQFGITPRRKTEKEIEEFLNTQHYHVILAMITAWNMITENIANSNKTD